MKYLFFTVLVCNGTYVDIRKIMQLNATYLKNFELSSNQKEAIMNR